MALSISANCTELYMMNGLDEGIGTYLKSRLLIVLTLFFTIITGCLQTASARPTVGLVLGGGAARGFSHIGIIKALEENGIPIDLLVGTSMGSIVAGLYACGYSTDNLAQIMTSLDQATLFDIPFPPRGGFLQTRRFETFLFELTSGKSFTELPIPFYSVISELRTGKELALHSGRVSQGIQASMSIPGIFPPVNIDGTYYIDGGMKNAVPVDVARRMGADIVIGVDVKKDLKQADYNSILNNLQLTLWFMTDGYVQQHEGDADVIITPDVKYDSYMEYERGDYFIQEGYEAGQAAINQIKQVILEKDPQFVFTPYSQKGFTRKELAQRISVAAEAAQDLPPDWNLKPVLLLTFGSTQRPGIGAMIGGGPLGYYQVGYIYRYALPGEDHNNEVVLAYDRFSVGKIELFARPAQDDATVWGLRYKRLASRDTELSLSTSAGANDVQWEANVNSSTLWRSGQWRLAANANLSGTAMNTMENTTFRLSPEVVWYTRANATPILELATAQPYLYAGLDHTVTLSDTNHSETNYNLGAGVTFQLFGLYPSKARAGISLNRDGEVTWSVTVGLR